MGKNYLKFLLCVVMMALLLPLHSVGQTVTCPKPVSIQLVGASQTTATLGWQLSDAKLGNPTKYYLTLYQGETVVLSNQEIPDPNFVREYQITGLTASTEYRATLQSDCTDDTKGKSELSDNFIFTTLCEAVAVPYSNDFESKDAPMSCWMVDYSGNKNKVSTGVYAGNAGSGQSAQMYASRSAQAYITTPMLNFAANNMQVDLKYYCTANVKFTVGVMTDPYDMGTYVPLYSDSVATINTWTEIRMNTASYGAATTGAAIAIMVPSGATAYMYIDDFSVTEKPACPRLERLSVVAVDSTSATISWVDYDNVGNYEVQVGTDNPISVTTNPYTLTGLNKNSSYTVKVRAVCTGTQSEWSKAIDVTTYCGTAATNEFIENFDAARTLPDCWAVQDLIKGGVWKIDTKNPASGTNSLVFARQSGSEMRSLLIMQPIQVPAGKRYDLSFDMYRGNTGQSYYASEGEGVRVWASHAPNITDASAVELGMVHNHSDLSPVVQTNGHYNYEFNVPLEGTVYVMIEGINLYSGISTYLDNVRLREAPTCREVRNIRVDHAERTSIFLTWDNHPASSANTYLVDVTTEPASSAEVSMPVTVTGRSYEITGLTAGVPYKITARIATTCGGADGNAEYVEQTLNYSTLCDPIATFPVTQGFESEVFPPACWTINQPVVGVGSPFATDWVRTTTAKYINSGVAAAQLGVCRQGAHTNLISPQLDLGTEEAQYTISYFQFRSSDYGYEAQDGIAVWVNDRPDTIGGQKLRFIPTKNSFEPTETVPWAGYAFYKYTCTFTGSGLKYVIFDGINSLATYRKESAIDDISIYKSPDCDFLDVNLVSVSAVTSSTATFTISDHNIMDWSVSYGPKGFDPSTGTVVRVAGATINVTNLNPDTEYEYYVQLHCNGGQASGYWSEAAKGFKTHCLPMAITEETPFFEGFEEFGFGEQLAGCYVPYATYYDSDFTISDNASEGEQSAYLYMNDAPSYSWIFRSFTLQAGKNYAIGMRVMQDYDEPVDNQVVFGVGKFADHQSMKIHSRYDIPDDNWHDYSGFFTVPADGDYVVGYGVYFDWDRDMYVDSLTLEIVECIPPVNMSVTDIEATTATIQFESTASQWEIKVSTAEFDPETGFADVFSDVVNQPMKSLTNLVSNTLHYYAVRSFCDGKESKWSSVKTFRTACEMPTIPWVENFSDGEGNNLNCWDFVSLDQYDGDLYVGISNKYSRSTYSFAMRSIIATSPTFDVESLADYELSGWVLNDGYSARSFQIGVSNSSDPDEFEACFVPLANINLPDGQRGIWQDFSVRFADILSEDMVDSYGNSFANAKNFVIVISDNQSYYLYFDDMMLLPASNCAKVQEPEITATGRTTVTADWIPDGDETEWQMIATLNGEPVADEVVTAHPGTLNGLNPNTEYELYIRSVCGEGDTSGMRYVSKFATICGSYPMPYDNSFGNGDASLTCWEQGLCIPTSTSTKWEISPDGTIRPKYPDQVEMVAIYSPYIPYEATDRVMVNFDYKFGDGDSLGVYLLYNDGQIVQTFSKKLDVIKTTQSAWRKASYEITNLLSANYNEFRIVFAAWANNNYYTAEIDNFSVEQILPVARPVGLEINAIGINDAQFTIVDTVVTASAWQYVVVANGAAIDNVTPVNTDSKQFTVEGLSGETAYDIYVRSVNGSNISAWRGPITFRTNCDAQSLPFVEGFETLTSLDGTCFSYVEKKHYSNPSVEVYQYGGYEGKRSLRFNTSPYDKDGNDEATYSIVALPEFEQPITNIKMSFFYKSTTNKDGVLSLGIMQDPSNAASFVELVNYPRSSSYTKLSYDFSAVSSQWTTGHIAFKVSNGGGSNYIYIDNIEIYPLDFCDRPTDLALLSYSETGASFSWTAPLGVTQCEYLVETLDGTQVETAVIDETNKAITGLTEGTEYLFKVRSYCADDNQSAWVELPFRTMNTIPVLPYTTGFEDAADNASWHLINGSQLNHFVIGSDEAGVKSGANALYVSDFNDLNHYSYSDESVVYAVRTFHFTPGQYLMSYDWKGVGDNTGDFARVFLAPVMNPLVAGRFGADKETWLWGDSYFARWDRYELSDKTTALDGNRRLNRQFTWTSRFEEFTITTDTVVNLVIAWRNNSSGGAQTPFAIDNLMIEKSNCPTLENVALTALSDTEATVTYSNMHEANTVIYALSFTNDVEAATRRDTIEGQSIVLDNLKPATEYYLFVRTKCDDVHNATWSRINFTTLNKVATLPYVHGFETEEENAMWQTAHAFADVNRFVIGSAEHAGAEGTQSLYISNDGTSFDYNGAISSKAYAFRTFDLKKGLYTISYDWKSEGELVSNGYDGIRYTDYGRVFLAPTDVIVKAGANLFTDNTLVEGCIALDDKVLASQAAWKNTVKQVLLRNEGKYSLVVAWQNDNNGKTKPVAIDNVTVTLEACAALADVTLNGVTTTTADVSLFNINESDVIYAVSTNDNVEAIESSKFVTVSGTSFTITGLQPDTRYHLFVKAQCTETEASDWVHLIFTTECEATEVSSTVTSYETSFEELGGLPGLNNCWYEFGSANNWVANSLYTANNRAPRTGRFNIYYEKEWGNSQPTHNAYRRFDLEGGKYYKLSVWGISSSDNYFSEIAFADFTADPTEGAEFASRELNAQAYSNLTGYFYAPESGIYNLGLRLTTGADFTSVDDYSVAIVDFGKPLEFAVDSITKTSAYFTWVANADSYHFVLTSRGVVIVDSVLTDTHIKVTGLTGATSYTATVSATKGTDVSANAELKFFTDCDVYALPYMQTFQDAYAAEIPACWDNVSSSMLTDYRYNWSVATEVNDKFARLSTSGAYGTATLLSPAFRVDDTNYALSFRYRNTSAEQMIVRISSDAGATFSEPIQTYTTANDWETKVISLDSYNGKDIMVAFEVQSKAVGTGLFVALDNIRVACYAGERTFTDDHCTGYDYTKDGFFILRNDIKVGVNTFTVLKMADIDNGSEACDTFKILTLTVNPTKETPIFAEICEGDVYSEAPFDGNNAKSETGNYVMSYEGKNGCDSNIVLHLTVLPKNYYLPITICEGDAYTFGGVEYSESGSYTITETNHLGCDSIVTLRLEVVASHYNVPMYVCEGTTYEWKEADNMILSETREYSYVFTSAGGCDSIVTIDFHVIPTNTEERMAICAGSSIIFGQGADAEEISKAGTYIKTYKNSLGCDSIVTLILRVNDPIVSEQSDYVCQDYEYNNYGFRIPVITQDTVLTRTLKNADDCDSTIIVNVEFIPTVYTDSLMTINEGESFEFCGTTYTTGGTYLCNERTADGCDSIIRLTLTVKTALDMAYALPITLAPNPVRGGEATTVNREWSAAERQNMIVEVVNSVGQVISRFNPARFPIEVNTVTVSGVYYVRVISGTGDVYVGKLIVK